MHPQRRLNGFSTVFVHRDEMLDDEPAGKAQLLIDEVHV
jgi:hypothetical protein